ncbi:hypothetical protein Tco_0148901 [Tanacetum coccineum]
MSGSQDEIPPPPPPPSSSQTPTQQTPHTVSTIKLPILKKGEYDIWAMKMEHYLAHTDYPIWEVIQNGNGPMWDAIKSRFGGNDESKKMQKYILKQQFECFSVTNSEGLHKGYDRFQCLLSQLDIHGAGVDSLSFDDLYNNLRVFENDKKGSIESSSSTQNVAFVSENTISTYDVSTAYGVANPSSQNSYWLSPLVGCVVCKDHVPVGPLVVSEPVRNSANDHLAKFHKMTDAKEMWDAIKSRFGRNDESKKMQKYILKQQFEGADESTENANQKYPTGTLPFAWSQVSLIIRTKPGVDSLSFDDLYNNLRVFENDVKGSTASSSSTQNVAFVSENTISTNDVSTAYGVLFRFC